MTHRYLVYSPCVNGRIMGQIFGPERQYAIALNSYNGNANYVSGADYQFGMAGHKWPCIHAILPQITDEFDAYCFLDDDIEVTMDDLNRLFAIGTSAGLNLWQASLSRGSHGYWDFLFHRDESYMRPVELVEVMMPCFSAEALKTCFPTFCESQSGYGLDQLWAQMMNWKGLAVVDIVQAGHHRPLMSDSWRLAGGMSAFQEGQQLREKYGVAR